MKRRSSRYPLDRLLDIRRREERERQVELARLGKKLAQEERRLEVLRAKRSAPRSKATTARQLQAEERSAASLRRRLFEARDARRDAVRAVERAEKALASATRLREGVERDRAEWEKTRRREVAAREQRDAEEVVHARHGKRR